MAERLTAADASNFAMDTRQSGFERLCARLIVRPLPLDRPLWELLIVPGVASDRTGVVFRVHHAMADGAAAVLLAQALMDPVAAPVADVARRADGTARSGGRFRTLASGFGRSVAIFRPAVPRTALLGDVGPRRSVAFVDVGLDALAAGARTAGATVNDALLVAVAAGARSALLARGERPPPTLPASVPVGLGDRGRSGNAVGVMLVPLPTDPTDIGLRLRRVAALTRARLGVAAISYDGALRCAVHCDADVLRAEVVARTLGKELAGVAALA